MLAALVAGERDPQMLASLALGALQHKRPQFELALTGQFTAHHGTLLALLLELLEVLDRQIATLDQQIGELVAPLQAQIAQLDSIPGGDIIAARDILAEIGTDRSRFGDAARLASWAGVCPGNHESAGKRYRGKTCKGHRYLRRVLVQCAWGARKTPTFLGRTCRRLEVRIGKKKAALAIAHKILVLVYHLLAAGTCYAEARYDQYNPRQEARERQRPLKALERLGYTLTLERAA
jgi:transposase